MQSYIAFFTILYSSTNAPIHLYRGIMQEHLFITRTFSLRKSKSLG